MRTAGYVALYMLLVHLGLSALVPGWVYHHRIDYELVKNNMAAGIEATIRHIATDIRTHKPDDYVIILGDSVAYAGPGAPTESLGYYLEEWGKENQHPFRVYNLGIPGGRSGDLYTALLMLQAHKVPLKRVVVNLVYAEFAPRTPDEPTAFWLTRKLRQLDRETWTALREEQTWKYQEQSTREKVIEETVFGGFAVSKYRSIIRTQLSRALGRASTQEVKDMRPWYEKENLPQLIQDPVYQRFYDPTPFTMTAANRQILVFQRLIGRLQDTEALFFFSPVNQDLLAEHVAHPVYQENMQHVDAWFAEQPVDYANWERAIPSALFADHVHLLPEGYRQLASLIGQRLTAAHGG